MNHDIRNLIFQAIDQTISPQDFDRLQDAMEQDDEVRAEYLRAVNLSETLNELASETVPPFRTIQSPDNRVRSNSLSRSSTWRGQFFRYSYVAVTAVLLAAMLLSFTQSWRSFLNRDLASSMPVGTRAIDSSVAKIVQRIDCVMQDEKWSLSNPFAFEPSDSVQVSEGLAIIEFKRGARVTLQGPAHLEIVSDNSGFLHSGQLTAVVPDSATGFEIVTPTSQVIDHGTEFGVMVDADGITETHVFEGEVEMILSNKRTQRLTESMGARIKNEDGSTAEAIPANPQNFIRILDPARQRPAKTGSVTELPKQENLAMWFEASEGIQLDGESRIVSWQNLAEPMQSADSTGSAAWQVKAEYRPLWESNSFGKTDAGTGWPAIKFHGTQSQEHLVTTPIATGDDVTAMVVCSFSPDSTYGTILGMKGLGMKGQASVVLGRDKFNAPNPQAITFLVDKNATPAWRRIALDAKPVKTNIPVLCAVRYSHEAKTFELFVNGKLAAKGETLGSIAGNAPRFIGSDPNGRRFFYTGSIAELVVYDHMLDQESFERASNALLEKYRIKATDATIAD